MNNTEEVKHKHTTAAGKEKYYHYTSKKERLRRETKCATSDDIGQCSQIHANEKSLISIARKYKISQTTAADQYIKD